MNRNESVLLITGWAHGTEAMQPVADVLEKEYDVRILTGAEVLASRSLPESDCIITGSMGGLLALELLPASCRKLVLISSTARFCSHEEYTCGTPEKILRRMILQFKRNPMAVLEEFFRNVHWPDESNPSFSADLRGLNSPEALGAGLEYLMHSDVREKIPSIQIPVLLLHGAEDRIIPCPASEWLHAQLPDSRLHIFEGHGHALLAHHFEECINEIGQFLSN